MQYKFHATLEDWSIGIISSRICITGRSFGNPKFEEGKWVAFSNVEINYEAKEFETDTAVYKLV